jgi:hypothetical protein
MWHGANESQQAGPAVDPAGPGHHFSFGRLGGRRIANSPVFQARCSERTIRMSSAPEVMSFFWKTFRR